VRTRVLVGVGAGLLLTAGLPPFGWWPLALLGTALLAHLLGAPDAPPAPRQRALVGLAVGVGFLAPGLWWMTEFTVPGWALAMLLEAGILTLAVAAVPGGRWTVLALPPALVLSDAVRGAWPFGGVPIAVVNQTQIGGPLLEAARLGGGLLVTALVAVAGVALAGAARRQWRHAAVGAAIVVVATVAGAAAPDGSATGTIRAAAVQGGGERGTRAVDTPRDAPFEAHRAASEDLPVGLDLVLWPEDVVDVSGHIHEHPHGDYLAALAERHEAVVVAGVVSGAGDEFVNEAYSWEPDGAPGDAYEKNQRVPFGEWIPFRSLVERIADVSAVPRDARVGRGPGLLATDSGDLGVVISYEVFFARRARDALRAGGEVLLVPTNATSYTTTQMPALEIGAARMRAVETGRAVVQAAPTGFSAFIDHRGGVHQQSDLGRRQVLVADVQLRSGHTPYTRLGDGPFVVLAVLALAAAWAAERVRPRAGA
jgi:apolipoprotein N-acyltransferase